LRRHFPATGDRASPFRRRALVASIRSSFYSTSADYDRAISIAEINLSKSLRRYFHRVIASASARPNLLDAISLPFALRRRVANRRLADAARRDPGPIINIQKPALLRRAKPEAAVEQSLRRVRAVRGEPDKGVPSCNGQEHNENQELVCQEIFDRLERTPRLVASVNELAVIF
jgi:hypothetical protein